MKTCSVLCLSLIVTAFFAGTLKAAESYVYKRGQDRYVTYTCTDADTREDGSTLCNASMGSSCENEIAEVRLYVDQTVGEVTAPATSVALPGGCYGNAMQVDLHDYPMRTMLYVYGVTVDTDGNISRVSDDNIDFRVTPAPPGKPYNLRQQ